MILKNNKKGFTLVELIVVITILAILGTIAFISLRGYSKNARNSVRVSDVSGIQTALELFFVRVGRYPVPTGGVDVTYSGAKVWTQGSFGDSVLTNVETMNKKPLDPLAEIEYTYSLLNTNKEFEIGSMFEGDIGVSFIFSETYAVDSSDVVSYIKGTYNQVVAKVNTGSTTYVLAVPTIISSDLSDTNIVSILSNKSLSYKGFSNIPETYTSLGYTSTGGFDYNSSSPEDIVVYTTANLSDLSTNSSELRVFTNNLQTAFTGTSLSNVGIYASVLGINTNVDSEVAAISGNIVNNSLGGNIDLSNIVQGPINTSGYAFSEIFGWINNGINVDGITITGYNQSEILGWLCFESSCGSTVTRNVSNGNLSGYGLSEIFGWINMTGVSINDAGEFSGYGQSEILGWISF